MSEWKSLKDKEERQEANGEKQEVFEREMEVSNIYTASFCTSGSLYARKAIAEGDGDE